MFAEFYTEFTLKGMLRFPYNTVNDMILIVISATTGCILTGKNELKN